MRFAKWQAHNGWMTLSSCHYSPSLTLTKRRRRRVTHIHCVDQAMAVPPGLLSEVGGAWRPCRPACSILGIITAGIMIAMRVTGREAVLRERQGRNVRDHRFLVSSCAWEDDTALRGFSEQLEQWPKAGWLAATACVLLIPVAHVDAAGLACLILPIPTDLVTDK